MFSNCFLFVILLGIPGAGKGTQAKKLSLFLQNSAIISPGDLIRKTLLSDPDSEVAKIVNRGELLSDELIMSLVESEVNLLSNKNKNLSCIIFDGIPRTLEQAQSLEILMKIIFKEWTQRFLQSDDKKMVLHLVLDISVKKRKALKRLTHRVICKNCFFSSNVSRGNVCPNCNAFFSKRADDTVNVIKKRLKEGLGIAYRMFSFYNGKDNTTRLRIQGDQKELKVFKNITYSLRKLSYNAKASSSI